MNKKKNRNQILKDPDGNSIVMINDVLFKGRTKIDWEVIENYLKKYVNDFYKILDSKDIIYIGKDFPEEYSHSEDTKKMLGALAKAKANASKGVPEMIMIANNVQYRTNKKKKHKRDAKYGWYYYDTRFAIPVYSNENEIERYNVFYAQLLVRHANDGKKYLYDVINVKKDKNSGVDF